MIWYMIWYDIWYDMIYSLTAIGLTPGCNSTVHINNTQNDTILKRNTNKIIIHKFK
jgi:hypothetical protein